MVLAGVLAGLNRRRCGLLNRLSRRTPATTGHIQPVPTRTMAKGDVNFAEQSKVTYVVRHHHQAGWWPMPHYNRCVTHRNRYLVPSLLSSLVS